MHRPPRQPVAALFHASRRLLQHHPALWVLGVLAGILVALQFSQHAATWGSAEALSALLAVGLLGLAFPLGWLVLTGARHAYAKRRRALAVLDERAEE